MADILVAVLVVLVVLVLQVILAMIANPNIRKPVACVMVQEGALFAQVMGGLRHCLAETTIAHHAETTMGGVNRVMGAELGKNE